MFSLQRLLGRETRFFDLLESAAKESCASIDVLIQFASQPGQPGSLDAFITTRRKEKAIAEEISEAVSTTFVTPIEREDIEALNTALYKIPKTVEKFGERLLLASGQLAGADFSGQTRLLGQATGVVLEMVRSLRKSPDIEAIKRLNSKLQKIEGEADNLVLELLRQLYSGQRPPVQIIILKDLYELLEKVIDRCRDVGNCVVHIVLKNS
jgi:uncharacterized protein